MPNPESAKLTDAVPKSRPDFTLSVTEPTLCINPGSPASSPSPPPSMTYLNTCFDHLDGLCSSNPSFPVNHPLIVSTTPVTLSFSHATLSEMPFHSPTRRFSPTSRNLSGRCSSQSTAVLIAFGSVVVKNVFRADIYPETATFSGHFMTISPSQSHPRHFANNPRQDTLNRSLQISAGSVLKLCAKMRCSLAGFWHIMEKKCQKRKIFSFGALLRHVDTIQKFALICAQFRILHA